MIIIHVSVIEVNSHWTIFHVHMTACKFSVECHVKITAELLVENDLFSMLSDRWKAPDHSVVLAVFDDASVARGQGESTHSNDLDLIGKEQPEYST